MDQMPANDQPEHESASPTALPEVTVAGDWTILAAIAAAAAALFFWFRRSRRAREDGRAG